ncbi:MAG: glycosyltransferase family 2 protein [Phycisphaeraceae bacterium]|nr:glycosyltransferase family 2 protein [Phycisphaeraceae bacterium]
MRIHALLVCRDEQDIIGPCLHHLLSWADTVHALDTGSTDATWDLIRSTAARDARIIPIARTPMLFHNGVRAWVFDRARPAFAPGDWVCRADADEIYHDDPRAFLRERIARHEHVVCAQLYDFILLRRDLRAARLGLEDPAVPIDQRRLHYIINRFPEIRFFRYRPSMRWPTTRERPVRAGAVAHARIKLRHYRWRTPEQAERRARLRAIMAPNMPIGGWHWRRDWRSEVRRARDPDVHRWTPGQPLPEVADLAHLDALPKRAMLKALSRLGLLPLSDRLAPRFNSAWRPAPDPTLGESPLPQWPDNPAPIPLIP